MKHPCVFGLQSWAASILPASFLLLCSSQSAFAAPGGTDNTFDGDGRVLTLNTQFGLPDSTTAIAEDVALQADGKILVAGRSAGGGLPNYNILLARYNTNGSLDTTFAGDGTVSTHYHVFVGANAVAVQSDGKILVTGFVGIEDIPGQGVPDDDLAVVRYNANGTVDTSFGTNGLVAIDFFAGAADEGMDLAIDANGKIVIGARVYDTANPSNFDFAFTRLNADGSFDTTFDGDGKVIVDFGNIRSDLFAIKLQSNGKIVAAGTADNPASTDFAVVRLNTNGSLDTTFSGDGRQTTDIASNSFEYVDGVAIQSDGKITVAGSTYFNNLEFNFAVVRYTSSGNLDTTFSGDGKQTTDFWVDDFGNGVAIQSNGRIVVAGGADDNLNQDYAFARYTASGNLDTTFSGDGKQTVGVVDTSSQKYMDSAVDVVIQPDGKIVAAGATHLHFSVVRLLP